MSSGVIALFLAVGSSTWIYTKFQRITGNDTKRSVIAAGLAGVLIFIISAYIFSKLSG